MLITSLSRSRGSYGDTFTIRGNGFGASIGRKIPSINRGRAYRLEVVTWADTRLKVRIPTGLPAGIYRVLVYFDSSYRTSSNSMALWVTAARVPATITNPYEVQVSSFKARYGKSDAWQLWMLDNRSRYEAAFGNALAIPTTVWEFFRYETTPIAYSPPWASEAEHMAALTRLAKLHYAGYDFRFVFGTGPAEAYGHVIGGLPAGGTSHASGRDVYLVYETIFGHEFAHVMGLPHHYDTEAEIGLGRHMPPGETGCIMDRNQNQFCSACRTALNVPLDVDNRVAIDAVLNEIIRRYPY